MHQVQIGKVSRSLPGSWNELSRKQIIHVCSLFNEKTAMADFKVKLLWNFLSVKSRLWKKMDAEDIYFLGETLNFLTAPVNLTKSLIVSFRCNRFPWTRYCGPADSMTTSTFGEFTKAQMKYEDYAGSKDPHALDELVAILFRRKKPFWFIRRHFVETTDPRVPLFDRTLADRTANVSTLPHELKYAVFLFFSGVYASLPAKFPNVYKSKPLSSNDKSGGWASLIISLADGKTDDESIGRIMNSNMYNVFLGLEHKSIEYFEFLKKHPPND